MKLGIIGAMDVEVATLKEKMENASVVVKAGMEFYEGTLEGLPAVVVKCGIGKVNAAMCAQILCGNFEVTHLVNTGIAGSLMAALDIGDLVISQDAIHHDFDLRFWGRPVGQVPDMGVTAFPADEEMYNTALAACHKVNPDINALLGLVVSGDQFISSKEVKDRLVNVFHGDCAEMEGASIAQASYLNNLPFIVIRAISDKADNSAEMDYPTFEKKAAEHCAKMVVEFVKSF